MGDKTASTKPALVLDTNVVLNWLFFQDAPTIELIEPLLRSHQWVCTEWMQAEARRVARSPHLAKYAIDAAFMRLDDGFYQHACFLTVNTTSPMRCRDPDDQIFLDLATQTQAVLLLSLDRDLLKLKKKARLADLVITRPDTFTLPA